MKDVAKDRPFLSELATRCGSDKGPSRPRYTELYDMAFRPFRDAEIRFFEMGFLIGGPENVIDAGRKTTASASAHLFCGFAASRTFTHKDPETDAAFQALGEQLSGCIVHQAHFDKSRRDQVAVIHEK